MFKQDMAMNELRPQSFLSRALDSLLLRMGIDLMAD